MKSLFNKLRIYVHPIPMVLFLLVPIAAIIHFLGVISERFAEFFNIYVSSVFRAMLAYITGFLPFSISETIILFLPAAVIALLFVIIPKTKNDEISAWRCVISLFSVIAYLYVSFVFTFALGYQGTSLSEKLDFDVRKVSKEELYETAVALTDIVNGLVEEIGYNVDGFSDMPYSYSELVGKLNDAYASLSDKLDFVPYLRANVKRIALSEPMTYTHISGVYTFFTGEANVNINFPDYTIPFTVAHEMSHQRGIAPEKEANFMAFLVCMESDDPYIRYSGAQNILEYVHSALYKASPELYRECYYQLDSHVRGEMTAYNDFFEKYEKNVAATVTGTVNNAYLQLQGTEGTRSYGLVTDLTVVYFCDGHYAENEEK